MIDVRPYLGLRYHLRGRRRPFVDCWGLVRLFYLEQLGIELAAHDTAAPVTLGVIGREASGWTPVTPGEARAGDVILLRRIGRPLHVGVVIDQRRFLHVDEGIESRVEPIAGHHGRAEFYRHPQAGLSDP